MEVHIKRFDELTASELYEILRLRSEVFVVEQNCVYQDLDGKDRGAWHVWLSDERGVTACLRVYNDGDTHIGRVVTRYRREGLGTRVLEAGIRVAAGKLGAGEIFISAQCYAVPFYEKSGFVRYGEEYLEDGIPHVGMRWTGNGADIQT